MKRILNYSLYIIIFLLIVSIIILSIKKFFYEKSHDKLNNIIASNFVSDFVSYNKIEELGVDTEEIVENIEVINITESVAVKEENDKEIKPVVNNDEEETIIENKEIEENPEEILLISETISKLDNNLKNELSGLGGIFVEYYKQTGLDPFLAAAIVLHETGCNWNCSNLVKECFNYGGMKGGENKYKDTNYTCYSSKEEGLNAYLNMLYNNYYSKGLTTPELINPKYASSLEWSVVVNKYINMLKS